MASAEAAVETAKLNEHSLHLSGREIGFDSLWDHQQNRNTVRNRAISFFLVAMAILFVNAVGCSYLQSSPPNGKVSVQAVSWKLVKKLAEPNAGLSGHKVSILNPADKSVVASGTTDSTGIIEFDLPPGTYTLIGASDEPQSVHIQSGQTANFKLVVH